MEFMLTLMFAGGILAMPMENQGACMAAAWIVNKGSDVRAMCSPLVADGEVEAFLDTHHERVIDGPVIVWVTPQ